MVDGEMLEQPAVFGEDADVNVVHEEQDAGSAVAAADADVQLLDVEDEGDPGVASRRTIA